MPSNKKTYRRLRERMKADPAFAEHIRKQRCRNMRAAYQRIKERMKTDPEFAKKIRAQRWKHRKKYLATHPHKKKEFWARYYKKNRERLIQYAANYQKTRRAVDPEWCEKISRTQRRWRKKYGKAYYAAFRKRYRAEQRELNNAWSRDPAKKIARRAHYLAGLAVRSGKIKKAPCRLCGAKKVEKHHPDYNRPLYIWWVCRPCHLYIEGRTLLPPDKKETARILNRVQAVAS